MKSWFTRLGISAALDADHKMSASQRRRIDRSGELRGFEKEVAGLDRALRQAPPKTAAPRGLHAGIMRAVRAAECPAEAPRPLPFLRWVTVPLVTLLVLVVAGHVLRRPPRPTAQSTQSLAAASTALEMSSQLTQTMPAAMVAPLADELERLNRDLDNTAQFILASLP